MKRLVDEPEGEFAKFVGSNVDKSCEDLWFRKKSLSVESLVYEDEGHLKEIQRMAKEERIRKEDDKVSFLYEAYRSYFKHGRLALTGPLLVLAFGLAQLNATSADYFLKLWTDSIAAFESNSSPNRTIESTPFTMFIVEDGAYIYLVLIVCFFMLSVTRFISLAIFCMRVSVKMHQSFFERIVLANMKFFSTNPVGIILNRFSVSR